MSASLRISWPGSKEWTRYFAQLTSKRKGQLSLLKFNPFWTSVNDKPYEANTILASVLELQ